MLFWTNNDKLLFVDFQSFISSCSLKNFKQKPCKRMSNLNQFLFQKIVLGSLKFHALERHELRSIIPKVCQVKLKTFQQKIVLFLSMKAF